MKVRLCLFATLILAAGSLSAFQVESLDLHVQLSRMAEARPPFVFGNDLVLSASGPYRTVGASFAFENFTVVHAYQRNTHGIFLLVLPIPLEVHAPLAYRVVLDGVWTTDPVNPLHAPATGSRAELSLVEVPALSSEKPGTWKIVQEDGRTVRFRWRGPSGEYVTVAGDFNNWDPFLNELEEVSPGLYELTLRLAPGAHFYAFVHRGQSFPDPLNPDIAASLDEKLVSVLVTGGARPPLLLARPPPAAPAEAKKESAAAGGGGGGGGGH